MKVAIRVDGSPHIGMGHVVRSLALGGALRRAGHAVFFFSRFEPGISRLRAQGFAVQIFSAGAVDGPGKEYEAAGDGAVVAELLAGQEFDCLVTDSYRVDPAYFAAVRPAVPLSVYVDDLNRFPASVDGVVNGNINAASLGYERWPAEVRRWLGCRYNLLREEFRDLPLAVTPEATGKVLLTGGGGDPGPVLAFLARTILDSPKLDRLQLMLVAPQRSLADGEFSALERTCPERLRVCREVADMLSLMRQSDLAISAGGTTLYELCAAGVPRMAYILADNQREIVGEMARQGLVLDLGPAVSISPKILVDRTAALIGDHKARDQMRRRGRELVDGLGADRVAVELERAVAAGRGRAG